MKPKEKAKELVEKFMSYVDWMDIQTDEINRQWALRNAKQCAIIAVDLAIEYNDFHLDFLYNIKSEIEKI